MSKSFKQVTTLTHSSQHSIPTRSDTEAQPQLLQCVRLERASQD